MVQSVQGSIPLIERELAMIRQHLPPPMLRLRWMTHQLGIIIRVDDPAHLPSGEIVVDYHFGLGHLS